MADLFLPVVQDPSVNSSHTIGVSIQVNSLDFSSKKIQAQLKKQPSSITWVTGAFPSPRTHRECLVLVTVNIHAHTCTIVFVIRSSIEERWIYMHQKESKERVSDCNSNYCPRTTFFSREKGPKERFMIQDNRTRGLINRTGFFCQ